MFHGLNVIKTDFYILKCMVDLGRPEWGERALAHKNYSLYLLYKAEMVSVCPSVRINLVTG